MCLTLAQYATHMVQTSGILEGYHLKHAPTSSNASAFQQGPPKNTQHSNTMQTQCPALTSVVEAKWGNLTMCMSQCQ